MSNINDSYFDGQYKDIWKALTPADLTIKETDFIVQYFGLQPGSKVLDLMCGYGRHTLALAEKGIEVTAVDNLADYINEIKNTAAEKSLPVKAIQADAASFTATGVYDLAICMGNSINFFPENDVNHIIATVAASLKPGGAFLINSWSLAEIAIPQFRAKTWSPLGELKFITDSKFLFQPTRIESETIMLSTDGSSEVKMAIDYVYSVAEMEKMFQAAGLRLKEMYSFPGRKKFAVGDSRVYMIAEKIQ